MTFPDHVGRCNSKEVSKRTNIILKSIESRHKKQIVNHESTSFEKKRMNINQRKEVEAMTVASSCCFQEAVAQNRTSMKR